MGHPEQGIKNIKGKFHALSFCQGLNLVHYRRAQGFPGGSVRKDPPGSVGDIRRIPDLRRSQIPQHNC